VFYKVRKPCGIGGVEYNDGAIISGDAVPQDSWPSVRILGLLEECSAPVEQTVEATGDTATPEPDTEVSQSELQPKKGKK